MGKFSYSGMLTQASTDESNEAFIKLLTDKNPVKSVESQTQGFQLKSNVVHPVAYILGSSIESHTDGLQLLRNVLAFLCQPKVCSFYLQSSDLLVHLNHKSVLKIFPGNTNNKKCNTWGLEATVILRHVKYNTLKE